MHRSPAGLPSTAHLPWFRYTTPSSSMNSCERMAWPNRSCPADAAACRPRTACCTGGGSASGDRGSAPPPGGPLLASAAAAASHGGVCGLCCWDGWCIRRKNGSAGQTSRAACCQQEQRRSQARSNIAAQLGRHSTVQGCRGGCNGHARLASHCIAHPVASEIAVCGVRRPSRGAPEPLPPPASRRPWCGSWKSWIAALMDGRWAGRPCGTHKALHALADLSSVRSGCRAPPCMHQVQCTLARTPAAPGVALC